MQRTDGVSSRPNEGSVQAVLGVMASLFKSRAELEAEILILRQQINVLRRRTPKRPHLNNSDRFLFVWLYHWFPSVLGALAIVRPETIIRWHRAGLGGDDHGGHGKKITFLVNEKPVTVCSAAENAKGLSFAQSGAWQ
jgi:hypothetical protein